ncbi:MAG TPA: hypothetical protein VN281_21685 [Verrucomicrobiae bacterium]|nr:hypothetical protein [Verrucomicrobiae bacterium]
MRWRETLAVFLPVSLAAGGRIMVPQVQYQGEIGTISFFPNPPLYTIPNWSQCALFPRKTRENFTTLEMQSSELLGFLHGKCCGTVSADKISILG